ncbi:2-oxo-4-hydroxy-4-carboxy-5-ureidoimidazoline decarboxylase, partial [Streptomyces calidiresistens]|uniref:2-oxo-4-hydroxy-4-carboxy-5-ureidoimidazoline decarboxylase n=1 Tax=Streptomyces calidiresistens TaxID=1485586 RepID=UPI003F693081
HDTAPPPGLRRLNAADPADAEALLLTCCGSRRWARRVAEHRPYRDTGALLAAGDEAAYDLTPADLAEALAAEPHDAATLSVGADAGDTARTALHAALAVHEERFGHGFVLHLDPRHPEEWLDRTLTALRSRLAMDPETEREHAAEQLRHLARARLERLAGSVPGPRPAAGGDTPAAPNPCLLYK